MEHEHQEYKGHIIELRSPEANELVTRGVESAVKPELLIDDEPIRYGQLPDGSYYLDEYAYDWQGNLMDLAKRFIDYKSGIDEIRDKHEPGEGE